MRSIPTGARRLAAALLLAAGAASAQGTVPERRVGLITHEMDAANATLLQRANVRHVKTTLYWHLWEGQPTYPSEFAAGIQRLAAAGFEITVVAHSPPSWASYQLRDSVYRAYARFVGDRAKQFPSVKNWQLWNEMDAGWTDLFGWGLVSHQQQGQNYAAMLNLAAPRIKQGNAKALVVVGGLGGDSITPFVRGIYAGKGTFDVMAIHAYGLTLWDAAQQRGTAVRSIMQANGDKRPMWLTEFGIDSTTMERAYLMYTPAQWDSRQQWEWSNLTAGNDGARLYARLVGYVLYDKSDYGFGIVRADLTTLRPTYTWLQQRNR
jgi:hypothetical protein